MSIMSASGVRVFGRFSAAAGLAFAMVSVTGSAHAYQLGDHAMITRRAVEELNVCLSNIVGKDLEARVQASNRNEDLNLFKKWSTYSHFYHPKKVLSDMRRLDSSLRVAEVEHAVEKLLSQATPAVAGAFSELGHAIHHIQDAASPPHVVPVMHGLADKFEGQDKAVDDLPDFDMSAVRCAEFQARAGQDSLLKILEETAAGTLDTLSQPFQATRDGKPETLYWTAFWREGAGNAFGEYGYLGNTFGQTTIKAGGLASGTYRIEPSVYRELNRRQLRIAIDGTRRALHWIVARDWGN
jgi:hypothetical protein